MQELVYRFSKKGSCDLPLQIRSSGYYRVWDDWKDLVIRKFFVELFWGIGGEGCVEYGDGNVVTLTPGYCCCYFPGDLHKVYAKKDFEFCWMTFDGGKCLDVANSFALSRTPWRAGACPQELFARLRRELRKPGAHGEVEASIAGYEILCRAVGNQEKPDDTELAERFISEVENSCGDSDLTVEIIAQRLGVHRSTLMRKVSAICGESPQKYLTECRLQRAMTLLQDSGLSIKEIAECSGFASANYFCKVFSRTFGKAPGKMRDSR